MCSTSTQSQTFGAIVHLRLPRVWFVRLYTQPRLLKMGSRQSRLAIAWMMVVSGRVECTTSGIMAFASASYQRAMLKKILCLRFYGPKIIRLAVEFGVRIPSFDPKFYKTWRAHQIVQLNCRCIISLCFIGRNLLPSSQTSLWGAPIT